MELSWNQNLGLHCEILSSVFHCKNRQMGIQSVLFVENDQWVFLKQLTDIKSIQKYLFMEPKWSQFTIWPYLKPVQSDSHLCCPFLLSVLILSFHLHLDLPSGLFPCSLSTDFVCPLLFSLCIQHIPLTSLFSNNIRLRIKSWSTLCSLLQSFITLFQNILLSTFKHIQSLRVISQVTLWQHQCGMVSENELTLGDCRFSHSAELWTKWISSVWM